MALSSLALRRLLNSTSISPLLPNLRSLSLRPMSTTNETTTARYIVMRIGREYGDDITDDGVRAGLTVREMDNGVLLQKAMPGLCKDDVKVSVDVDKNTLKIEAYDWLQRPYQTLVNLPPMCKNSFAMANMKDGMLRVTVGKRRPGSPPYVEEGQTGKSGGTNEYVVRWSTEGDGY